MKVPRIAGVDLAYAISVCVVVAFCLSVGLSKGTSSLSPVVFNPWVDAFIGMFFFLNGITTTLMLSSKRQRTSKVHRYFVRKGIVFFTIGALASLFWPVNFLMTLGLLFALSPIFLQLNSGIVRFLFILVFAICVMSALCAASSLAAGTIGREGFDTVFVDLVDSLFVSGYDRIAPWSLFFLTGVLHGRSDILNRKKQRRSTLIGVVAIVIGSLVQVFGGTFFTSPVSHDNELIFPFFPSPDFSIIAFLLFGLGICIVLLNLCLKIMTTQRKKGLLTFLQRFGALKHTFFLNHILFGGLLCAIFQATGFQNVWIISCAIILYLSVYFAFVGMWKKPFTLGPVEWVLQQLAGINENS